mmetsp:Transcript_7963/g.7459  ORF Transcript_7963/g.7459 Transcript_7963/m.7459 type:complete len:200 (+) Transcript_7963:683-1282(+)
MRSRGDDFDFELEGGHSNIVRQVKVSDDGALCYSAGADNSLCIWDLNIRKCIKVYKNEKNIQLPKNAFLMGASEQQFHRDSIWSMDVSGDSQSETYVYTGGRDGSIYEVDVLRDQYTMIHSGAKDKPIVSLCVDRANKKLWYGSLDSSLNCIYLDKVHSKQKEAIKNRSIDKEKLSKPTPFDDYMEIKGLSYLTDYHIL